MSFGTSAKRKTAATVVKPAENLQQQFTRARDAARDKRHQQLVTVIESVADTVRDGLQQSLNGIPVTASRPVTITPGKNPQRIATSSGRLIGWSLANTGASAVHVRLRAGRDEFGAIVAVVDIPAGASSSMRVGSTGGVMFGEDGLTLETVPGTGTSTLEGSIHLGAVD